MADRMDLEAGHRTLPAELDREVERGLHVAATNHSDDVFMYWKGSVEDLDPKGRYAVVFRVEFASKSPAGCAGIGGAPGESVYVKAGAMSQEPEPVLVDTGSNGYWQMNIDKGNQANSGDDARVIGNVATEAGDCEDWAWGKKQLTATEPVIAEATDAGTMWLMVGTDSGFEGRTELYYTRVQARFYQIE